MCMPLFDCEICGIREVAVKYRGFDRRTRSIEQANA
jgi:hypothetical protein